MTTCLAPSCEAPKLALGVWEFLCLAHALEVTSTPPAPAQPRRLVNLRGRCWHDGMTCPSPATASTAHGGYCDEHGPAQPKVTAIVEDEYELRAGQLAVLAVMGAFPGSTISPDDRTLWATRAYGEEATSTNCIAGRTYPRSTPSRAITVNLDDPRVTKTARGMARGAKGWSVRLRAVDEPASLNLRAWRGSLLVVASWVEGSFVGAWLQQSHGQPVRLGAREAGKLLKLAP